MLEGLDDASRAAIALIFLHPAGGVPSPIESGNALDTVMRLTGKPQAEIATALVTLDDSLTRRVRGEEGDRWVFRHPTITDAFATIVGQSPELVELYVGGARVERLVREVVCAPKEITGAHIRVPVALYPTVRARLADHDLDETLKSFLGQRCDDTFLRAFVAERPEVLEWAQTASVTSLSTGAEMLFAALHRARLLQEEIRVAIVARLTENAVEYGETAIFENERMRPLFTAAEWTALETGFHREWLYELSETFSIFSNRFSSTDEHGLYTEFKENMERAERYFGDHQRAAGFVRLLEQIEDHLDNLPYEEDYPVIPNPLPHRREAVTSGGAQDIFLDIDED